MELPRGKPWLKTPITVESRDGAYVSLLSASNLQLNFGGIAALSDVTFDISEGELLAVIGPNGAGKTSLLNCITGFYRPQQGTILFGKHVLSGLPPYKVAKLGVARTFQNAELFGGMTTVDNILAARHMFLRSFWSNVLHFGPARTEEIRNREIVEEIIDFLTLQPVRNQAVGDLSYGWRKRVDLARALATEPKVLLLDEPMAGLSTEAKQDHARCILDIFIERKIPIVIVEHDIQLVLDISSRVVVLDFGKKIADGPPDEVMKNPGVRKAYWGREQ